MAMDGSHKYVKCSSSSSRNWVDTIESHSVGTGVHKAKKFFSLRGKMANSRQCIQKINNQTYSDLVYDALHRPQCDIDKQNTHGCDSRCGADWGEMPGSQQR